MATKYFSIIDTPGKTVALTIKRKSDNYYWNGSSWQAGATTVAMTETAGLDNTYSEYSSTTAPTDPCFWWAKDSGGDLVDRGELSGVGTASSSNEADGTYPAFLAAYTEVREDTDNLVGTTEAKRLVNEALRMVSNDRHWDWVVNPAVYELDTVSGTKSYQLPLRVQQVIGAYSSDIREFRILPITDFRLMNFNNRTSGTPTTLFTLGDNIVFPDPVPDGVGPINIFYKKNYHLTADADAFPCNRDFADAVKTLAKYFAASRRGKSALAKHFAEVYEVMIHNLRVAQVSSEFIVPGQPGYMF